jgi:hypothetical protein
MLCKTYTSSVQGNATDLAQPAGRTSCDELFNDCNLLITSVQLHFLPYYNTSNLYDVELTYEGAFQWSRHWLSAECVQRVASGHYNNGTNSLPLRTCYPMVD